MITHIEIGEEKRRIEFNFNCLQEIVEFGGIDVLNGVSVHGNFQLGILMTFTGLKYGVDPEGRISNDALPFDMKKVGSWIKPSVMEKVIEAFNSQCGTGQKKTEPVKESRKK